MGEASVCDEIKKGPTHKLFHQDFVINGKEDAANNFARGHYTTGKEIMDSVSDRLKKSVEDCDNLQGFIMTHSVGGGTGSGLGMLILERLAVDYRKKSKIGFEIYPSPNISNCIVEPYNGLLSTTERSRRSDSRYPHLQTSPTVSWSHTTDFCLLIGSWTTLMSPLFLTTKQSMKSAKINSPSRSQVTII